MAPNARATIKMGASFRITRFGFGSNELNHYYRKILAHRDVLAENAKNSDSITTFIVVHEVAIGSGSIKRLPLIGIELS